MRTFVIAFMGGIVGTVFTTMLVLAWTGPTSAPPNGNVAAPINVGTTDQVKDGGLAVNALAVFGNSLVTGNITAVGFFHSSDARLKKDVATIDGSDIIGKLRGVTFRWRADDAPSAGVIAQEVENVLPSAVHTLHDGTKVVDYDQLIAVLIEAVKAQQREIDALKAERP